MNQFEYKLNFEWKEHLYSSFFKYLVIFITFSFYPSLDTCIMFSTTDHSHANTLPCSVCPRGNNLYDRIAILVIAPPAGCILVRLLGRVTCGPPNTQWVLNVAGQTIGRVPGQPISFHQHKLKPS